MEIIQHEFPLSSFFKVIILLFMNHVTHTDSYLITYFTLLHKHSIIVKLQVNSHYCNSLDFMAIT